MGGVVKEATKILDDAFELVGLDLIPDTPKIEMVQMPSQKNIDSILPTISKNATSVKTQTDSVKRKKKGVTQLRIPLQQIPTQSLNVGNNDTGVNV
jgi:hypothetical protein